MEESDDIVEDIGILGKDDNATGTKHRQESQPKKENVSAFKSRVFHLLLLFVEKSKKLSHIMPLLTEEAFMSDPTRIRELIIKSVNRNALNAEDILRFAHYYKKLLLFKNKKDSQKYGEDFIQILKKLRQESEESPKEVAQEMLQSFILKRNCKINVRFFSYLLKKLPWLKEALIEKGKQIQKRKGVRPAQERILQKLMNSLIKNRKVKEEHQEDDE